jgi:hypothetical protein
MPTYLYGSVGEWTGCGFFTIPALFPPPNILGYNNCVPVIVSNPPELPPFVGPPVGNGSIQGPGIIV